jgi:DUF971 family protein
MAENPPVAATEIKLRTRTRVLEVAFADGARFELPFEYLRVYSPSAEVQGHGQGEGVLVLGKETVGVSAVEPIGHYAVRLIFDDGHSTGLYTWKYLYELGSQHARNWSDYQARRAQAAAGGGANAAAGAPAGCGGPVRGHADKH